MAAETASTAAAPNLPTKFPVKAEQWEIDVIAKFVLELYHNKLVTKQNDWIISKIEMRQEYAKFIEGTQSNREFLQKINAIHGSLNIGSLLFRTGFLINTPRGCSYYRIKAITLFEYRNNLMKIYDKRCISGESIHSSNASEADDSDLKELQADKTLEETHEVDENAPKHKLKFQGGTRIRHNPEFQLSSTGCLLCEENFETNEEYEEHVIYHGDDSDFQSLNDMHKSAKNVFELSYQECAKSHFFCFTMERIETGQHPNKKDKYGNSSSEDEGDSSSCDEYTEIEPGWMAHRVLPHKRYHHEYNDIRVDKIVIVQSRSMYHVKGSYHYFHESYTPSRSAQFFVDSHLFTRYLEQPIVIVYHYEFDKRHRYIEQHHFMRQLEFPTVSLCINPRRLPNKMLFKPKIYPLQYLPPKDFRNAVKQSTVLSYALNHSNEFRDYYENGKQLSLYNIRGAIRLLLQMEDVDTLHEYFQLTQQNVKLRQFGNEYSLKIRQFKNSKNIEQILSPYDDVVAIRSTSDCLMDFNTQRSSDPCEVLLKLDDQECKKKKKSIFFGLIDRISNGRVTFVCHNNINIDETYCIIFRPNRMNLRNQHRALELLDQLPASDVQRVLFPANVMPIGRSIYVPDLVLTNKQIYDNPEQLQAVKFIAYGPRKEAPYIIHGPPGTGKTTTLTEAILQLYMRSPHTKILITASSNSACDEIALRLCRVLTKLDETRAIVRIYSASNERRLENIDELLIEHSNMYAGQFYPHIDVLHEYRIIVCTLSVVGRLSIGKFGRNNLGKALFTHVVFDEVAATTEAEVLMALTGVLGEDTRIIMAGDHKQLSAVLKSNQAEELGLGKSIMERLLERDCYKLDANGCYDPSIQTRLLQNHRSHPAIVQIYNDLFYDGKLKAMMDSGDHPHCRLWVRSLSNTFPIIFHSVFGQVERDNSSVSIYNAQELRVVMDYVKDLMYFGINGLTITQQDIGIISPYKRQYMYIQDELNLRNWYGIETGSVETFQGREKSIIIVSFVRSFTSTLGFLDNMKRLNVTLSRAKSLLILIGNPKTLSQSSEFSTIIDLCKANNTLVGRIHGDNDMTQAAGREQTNATTDTPKKNFPKNNKNKKRQQQNNKKNSNEAGKNNSNNNNNQQGHDIRHPNRRQQMKHTTKPNHHHNAAQRVANKQHQQHNKKNNNGEQSASSLASSVQDLNIDDYFESLPTLNGASANFAGTPKDTKADGAKQPKKFDENELIERAKKLNIYHKETDNNSNQSQQRQAQEKPQSQAQAKPQPTQAQPTVQRTPQTTVASAVKPTIAAASNPTTQRSSNIANVSSLNSINCGTGRQPLATASTPNTYNSNFSYSTKSAVPAATTSTSSIRNTRATTIMTEEIPTNITYYSGNNVNNLARPATVSAAPSRTYNNGGNVYQSSSYSYASRPGAPIARPIQAPPPPPKEKKLCIIS